MLRKLVTLTGIAATATGLMVVPAAHAAGTTPVQARNGATTVTGPRMWLPSAAGGHLSAHPSSVTISQTTNLTNQMVTVSWTGFTPSSSVIYDPSGTDYPVMVAECDSPTVT